MSAQIPMVDFQQARLYGQIETCRNILRDLRVRRDDRELCEAVVAALVALEKAMSLAEADMALRVTA